MSSVSWPLKHGINTERVSLPRAHMGITYLRQCNNACTTTPINADQKASPLFRFVVFWNLSTYFLARKEHSAITIGFEYVDLACSGRVPPNWAIETGRIRLHVPCSFFLVISATKNSSRTLQFPGKCFCAISKTNFYKIWILSAQHF